MLINLLQDTTVLALPHHKYLGAQPCPVKLTYQVNPLKGFRFHFLIFSKTRKKKNQKSVLRFTLRPAYNSRVAFGSNYPVYPLTKPTMSSLQNAHPYCGHIMPSVPPGRSRYSADQAPQSSWSSPFVALIPSPCPTMCPWLPLSAQTKG